MSTIKKVYFLISIFILLLFFCIILACTGSSQVIKGTKNNPWSRDDLVRVGKVEWKILEVEDLGSVLESSNMFIDDKKTSGKFILVRFIVKNLDSDMKTMTDLTVVDNRDREFETFSESSFYIEDEEELFLLDNINPGISKTYTLIYEIPEDANELMLEVTSLEFAGDREYIDLGL